MFGRKSKKESRVNPARDALARKIAGWVIRLEVLIVRQLQKWERRCTLLQKKIILIAFCICFGGYCGWILLRTFFSHDRSPVSGMVQRSATVPVVQPPSLPAGHRAPANYSSKRHTTTNKNQ